MPHARLGDALARPIIVGHELDAAEALEAKIAAVVALAGEPGLMARMPDMIATWKRKAA